MEKKFELTDEFIVCKSGKRLYRIRCLRDFSDVKAGDLGGFVEKQANLSHDGNAWVYGNATVHDAAFVYDDARVCDNAEVRGNARVYGNALVQHEASVYGYARVLGSARVLGITQVYDTAWVYGNTYMCGEAQVCGDAHVRGNAKVRGKAFIASDDDHCGFDCFGSGNRHTHAYKIIYGGIEITCGCFTGDIDEFERQVRETHGDNEFARQYQAIVNLIKIKFGLL